MQISITSRELHDTVQEHDKWVHISPISYELLYRVQEYGKLVCIRSKHYHAMYLSLVDSGFHIGHCILLMICSAHYLPA